MNAATSSTPSSSAPSLAELRAVAGSVCDPELPPLTLADLGILRDVERVDDTIVVTLTPTYSGCPAVEFIEDEVHRALEAAGCSSVRIERAFQPAWTTDWITDDGRRKLTEAGIAPPRQTGAAADGAVPVTLGQKPDRKIVCPRCGATTTTEISPFGSTACKALFRCDGCSEPFDYFKEI